MFDMKNLVINIQFWMRHSYYSHWILYARLVFSEMICVIGDFHLAKLKQKITLTTIGQMTTTTVSPIFAQGNQIEKTKKT